MAGNVVDNWVQKQTSHHHRHRHHHHRHSVLTKGKGSVFFNVFMETQPCTVDSVGPVNQGSHLLLLSIVGRKMKLALKLNEIQ